MSPRSVPLSTSFVASAHVWLGANGETREPSALLLGILLRPPSHHKNRMRPHSQPVASCPLPPTHLLSSTFCSPPTSTTTLSHSHHHTPTPTHSHHHHLHRHHNCTAAGPPPRPRQYYSSPRQTPRATITHASTRPSTPQPTKTRAITDDQEPPACEGSSKTRSTCPFTPFENTLIG